MADMQEFYDAFKKNQAQKVPEHKLGALNRYIENGIRPGSFLTAVLSNDLMQAFKQADDLNIANMFAIVKHLYNEIPIAAWGSYEKVRAWIKLFNDKQTIDN